MVLSLNFIFVLVLIISSSVNLSSSIIADLISIDNQIVYYSDIIHHKYPSNSSSNNIKKSIDTKRRRLKPKIAQSNLQYCYDSGEAYSASYLIHKEHLMYQYTDYNLTWVNCEMVDYYNNNNNIHFLIY
jgi:hypothetical protein